MTLGEFPGSHTKKVLFCFNGVHAGLGGMPSLRGRDACMVVRVNEASWRNCRQNLRKTSFSTLFVFLLSRMSGFLWVGWFFGIFGLAELGILGQVLPLFLLKFSMCGWEREVAYAW